MPTPVLTALTAEQLNSFDVQFKAITGNTCYPWQRALFLEMMTGIIRSVSLPTGTGKTSIMAIWLLALARQAAQTDDPRNITIPRRLVWVVNRRVVVDQATNDAEQLAFRLRDKEKFPELQTVRHAFGKLAAVDSNNDLFAISTLRGQFADNAEWRNNPARPSIIVGTVDMIGSRMLFAGYGCGFKSRPLHAGFLAQDVLLVHDEAHLEPAFQKLIEAIESEQHRCREFRMMKVMALTATSRDDGEKQFTLTKADWKHEDLRKRIEAKKRIAFHPMDDEKELANEVYQRALEFKESGQAILIFLHKVEDVEKVRRELNRANLAVQTLTGTMRGLERDTLAREDKIFARFIPTPTIMPQGGTVYLVCTSAGEVGINISADNLICDLMPFESMAQRFGRVNRFGLGDAQIDVVCCPAVDGDESNKNAKSLLEQARIRTLLLLKKLPQLADGRHDASPAALGDLLRDLAVADRDAAFTPPPIILSTSDILFDVWALTSIRERLPGRPPVEPYLHGLIGWEPPETYVAWRDEVDVIKGDLLEEYKPEDILEDYPLKPHELLRDTSSRVFDRLKKLKAPAETPVWIVSDDDSVEVSALEQLVSSEKDSLNYKTVLLPPRIGGLEGGMFTAGSSPTNDVSDELRDEHGNRRRIRVWDDDPQFAEKTYRMRLIRSIDIDPGADEGEEESDIIPRRYWHWYELPKTADNDGSKAGLRPVLWQIHTDDVVRNTTQIVQQLPLSDELRNAVILAAKFHDLGKRRPLFQRILGNVKTNILLAKSGKRKKLYDLKEDYRHEFGSLLDVQNEPEFKNLSDNNMKELILHLIAAHHGRGRPHFPTKEAFDPEPNGQDVSLIAAAVPQRFGRLQRSYGRWALAYLESLLRAADYAASAKPSAVVECDQ
jgi:CRISPR-associated endonuclease/helicase Cas3